MMPNTVQFHRVLRAVPEKVYRAFLDAEAMAKWLPPNGFTGKVHHMDAKVGGTYKMSFTDFSTVPIPEYLLLSEAVFRRMDDRVRSRGQALAQELEGLGVVPTYFMDLAE